MSFGKSPLAERVKLSVREREAAQILGVSPRTLWSWEQAGLIQALRIGRVKLYPMTELERLATQGAKGGDK